MFFNCCKSPDAVAVLEGKNEEPKPNAKSVSFSTDEAKSKDDVKGVSFSTDLPEVNARSNRSSLISSIRMLPSDSLVMISEDGEEGEEFLATSKRNTRSTYLGHSIKPVEGKSLKASMTSTIISDAKTNSSTSSGASSDGRSARMDFSSSHSKWKALFKLHDSDENGLLDVPELQEALAHVLCEDVSFEDAQVAMNHFGKEKKGFLDIAEFVVMLEFVYSSARAGKSFGGVQSQCQMILQNAATAASKDKESTLKEAASLVYPFREILHIQDFELNEPQHCDLSLSACSDGDFSAAFAPSEMRCLALVSHNGMKATMKNFVLANKNILKKFRLTGTNSTMTMLREVFKDEADEIVFGPSCQSGPLGGDAELVALMCSGGLGGMLFFQDPMDSHPHQADIDCLVRQALVHNTMMANTPVSALMMMSVFRAALKDGGKPELIPSFFFSLESPSVAAYKAGQSKVIASHSK